MGNTENLLKLIQENPELPVVPMVDSEVVADGSCCYWLGTFGSASVEEYYIGDEKVHIKSMDDEEDVLTDLQGSIFGRLPDGRDVYDLSDDEWDELYKSIPWEKAIVVYITT